MKNLSKNLFGIGILSIFATESYNMSNRREKNKPPQNQLNKQLDHEVKEKEKNENQIQLGKFFYSISGMTYAGSVLTYVMEHRYIDPDTLLKGILATLLFGVIGWGLVKTGNIKR